MKKIWEAVRKDLWIVVLDAALGSAEKLKATFNVCGVHGGKMGRLKLLDRALRLRMGSIWHGAGSDYLRRDILK